MSTVTEVKQEITEWRVGRNFIRKGDVVKVLPSRQGRRNGFEGQVKKIIANGDGEVVEVEVIEGSKTRDGRWFGRIRTFLPERIQRIEQTKKGEKKK